MAKHDDTLADNAAQRIAAPDPTPPELRLRKVPGRVSQSDLAIIQRAVCRYLANVASIEAETDELTGQTIAAICRAWLKIQADWQFGKGGSNG